MRSLTRPERRRFLTFLHNSIEEVEVRSAQGGLYLGRRAAFRIDRQRIQRVLSRIVRGLYFHELRRPVPENYDVSVELQPYVSPQLREVVDSIKLKAPVTVGEGVFNYCFQHVEEDLNSTLWVLQFYSRFPAIGFVLLPKSDRSELGSTIEPSTEPRQAGSRG
jgi:hypothetical protein